MNEGNELAVHLRLRAHHHLSGAGRAVREPARSAGDPGQRADVDLRRADPAVLRRCATINIYTQVGLVTLIGLISKHGILMVEFANDLQRKEGLDRRTAIEQAARIRLRPILMTTAAMVLGVVPLLLASGAGAASRVLDRDRHRGGMTIGTMFTLFVLPAVYVSIATDHRAAAEFRARAGRSPISISGSKALKPT